MTVGPASDTKQNNYDIYFPGDGEQMLLVCWQRFLPSYHRVAYRSKRENILRDEGQGLSLVETVAYYIKLFAQLANVFSESYQRGTFYCYLDVVLDGVFAVTRR